MLSGINLSAIILKLDNDGGHALPEVPPLLEVTDDTGLEELEITASGYPHITLDSEGV